MNLAPTLTVFADLIGDAIVNVAGQPVPGRILRHHGGSPPEDMDCPALAVWWEQGLGPKAGGVPCPGPLEVTLAAKYVVCWKIAKVTNAGIQLWDDTWDATSATLADVAEIVARILARLACVEVGDTGIVPDDAATDALAVEFRSMIGSPRLVGVTPARGGGAASVTWRIVVTLAPRPVPAVEPEPEPQIFLRTADDSIGVDFL